MKVSILFSGLLLCLAASSAAEAKMCLIKAKDSSGTLVNLYVFVGATPTVSSEIVSIIPLCANPPTVTIVNAMQRMTSNPFGGFEVLPKLPNGDCYANADGHIYDALQVVPGQLDQIVCPAWK